MLRRIRPILLPVLLLLAAPAAAQDAAVSSPGAPPPGQRCEVIPDTVPGPSEGQVAEFDALRDTLQAIGRRIGVEEPRGLLFVHLTPERRGRVLFLDANLPDAAVAEATPHVGRYLEAVEPGREFSMLVRVDGDYPAKRPGREHCRPALANGAERARMMRRILDLHPDAGGDASWRRRATLQLVVGRDGAVKYVDVAEPTGDEAIDRFLDELGARLRFHPARLDGEPFDARIRYALTFVMGSPS